MTFLVPGFEPSPRVTNSWPSFYFVKKNPILKNPNERLEKMKKNENAE